METFLTVNGRSEKLISIKNEMKKIGLDPQHILNIEYFKAQIYMSELIVRTEKSLIKLQEDPLMIGSAREKSIENTLTKLIFSHNKLAQMEGIIYGLMAENKLLNERIKLR